MQNYYFSITLEVLTCKLLILSTFIFPTSNQFAIVFDGKTTHHQLHTFQLFSIYLLTIGSDSRCTNQAIMIPNTTTHKYNSLFPILRFTPFTTQGIQAKMAGYITISHSFTSSYTPHPPPSCSPSPLARHRSKNKYKHW